ncbi:MAG: bacillithiol biosynthesis cysteine-adding enzyme BshC [Chitinophagaceae bacterium]|nr:bacillithiol biosynthesis cysteine-adding enzyme BshC [Chitinophagaceae bacterium]
MNYTAQWITYERTGAFSQLVTDYVQQNASLQPFFSHTPDINGIKAALQNRKSFATNRLLLTAVLQRQYEGLQPPQQVKDNIRKLSSETTFTVCTAHQPNIFTGYLYFIYKILHTVKLAEELKQSLPGYDFVPVYYMGSEDNDLEELNHIYLGGDNLVWQTGQTGAVGRMKPEGMNTLIEKISGQLSIFEFGAELIDLLTTCYTKSNSIQEATLKFVNALFGEYGLVILIPDHAGLKKEMIPVFEDDIFNHTAFSVVTQTAAALSGQYHAQVNPREINLFYMKDGIRERIIKDGNAYMVNNTGISFSADTLKEELHQYPERFSPNVVLRGLYQETLLPNLAFIGGGSELAYWMELKKMFEHYGVPYPVLLLRNSFLIINEKEARLRQKLDIAAEDLFKDEAIILNGIVKAKSDHQLSLLDEKQQLDQLYGTIETIAGIVDITLKNHVKALQTKAAKALDNLEKKIVKAEKRKFEIQRDQLHTLKTSLFPKGNLQERVENILPYYAQKGKGFIKMIYKNSPPCGGKFGILTEQYD